MIVHNSAPAKHVNNKFVCVINRNRDGYEVPLALEESGALEKFVTDFYAKPAWKPYLPGFLARREKVGLAASRTKMSMPSFLVQYFGEILRAPMSLVFRYSDRLLANTAEREAIKRGTGIYAYSSYLFRRPNLSAGAKIVDFEYHPHQEYSIHILRDDFKKYPAVRWSMELEEIAHRRDNKQDSWRYADAVVCASNMTKRSLIHAGCAEDRITVIPYGISSIECEARPRQKNICRFLFVGQGISRKGLHHLAEAWKLAELDNAELAIVAYKIDPGIEAMLDHKTIQVLGRQSRPALDNLFQSADVFVMPSLIEGFGLVYLEALQAGCHVVGTFNTGLPDLAMSHTAATILEAGDIEGIRQALIDLNGRKHSGALDPKKIKIEADSWSWNRFRKAISKHADSLV